MCRGTLLFCTIRYSLVQNLNNKNGKSLLSPPLSILCNLTRTYSGNGRKLNLGIIVYTCKNNSYYFNLNWVKKKFAFFARNKIWINWDQRKFFLKLWGEFRSVTLKLLWPELNLTYSFCILFQSLLATELLTGPFLCCWNNSHRILR